MSNVTVNNTVAYSSPFAHAGGSVTTVMLQVCLALIPCTVFGFYVFGWPAIFLFIVTCAAALVTELLCLYWLKHPWYRVLDGSALLTGWLIAITLPPWAPWWIGGVGGFFAIAVGKQLYGGIGQNIFNPAMLARTALLITFPVQMTYWVIPAPLGSAGAPGFWEGLQITFSSAPIADAYTGATSLGSVKTALSLEQPVSAVLEQDFSFWHSALGITSGSMGETSELLVLLGGLYLLWRGIIRWEIPVALLLSFGVLTLLFNLSNSQQFAHPFFHLSSGGVLLAAFFIATDPITSPTSPLGKLIFGVGCGVVIFIIRTWGGFPEAAAFAVLFMNGFTPLIDRYCRPRIYGRLPGGDPLPQLTTIELTREAQKRQ